jgi:hypothetical protein
MNRSRIAFTTAFGAAALLAMVISARAETRAVLELFTSQGCPYCPDADRILGKLAADPSLVTLTMPVDMWDYHGWKDTLANPRHSARQKAYAHIRGDRGIYTPQIIVNGAEQALGNERGEIEQAIAAVRRKGEMLSVPVKLQPGRDNLNVTVGNAGHAKGEVWLYALAKSVPVTIGRGENRGRTVTYHNVVRRWLKLGEWTGTSLSVAVPNSEFKADGIDAVAVIVQRGAADKPGIVLGAAVASLGQSRDAAVHLPVTITRTR